MDENGFIPDARRAALAPRGVVPAPKVQRRLRAGDDRGDCLRQLPADGGEGQDHRMARRHRGEVDRGAARCSVARRGPFAEGACRRFSSCAPTMPGGPRWPSAGSRTSARDRAIGWSGGSEPGTELNKVAIEAMAEVGIDISGELRRSPGPTRCLAGADVVVTMGCGDACPLVPGKHYEDWDVADPADQPLEVVRPIREEIERRVRDLLHRLDVEDPRQRGQVTGRTQRTAAAPP